MPLYTNIYLYVHLCTSIYISIHLYTSLHIYIHLCKSIYIYIHLHMPIYIYVCLYICIHIYIYICLYIYIYTYIYICPAACLRAVSKQIYSHETPNPSPPQHPPHNLPAPPFQAGARHTLRPDEHPRTTKTAAAEATASQRWLCIDWLQTPDKFNKLASISVCYGCKMLLLWRGLPRRWHSSTMTGGNRDINRACPSAPIIQVTSMS